MHAISSSLKRNLNSEGNEIRSVKLLKNGNCDTDFILTCIEIKRNIIVLCDGQTFTLLFFNKYIYISISQ